MSVKVKSNMKTLKNLYGMAMLLSLGMTAATSYAQQNWDYSYTFGDGVYVSGTFEGYAAGNLVDNITDVTLDINGIPQAGSFTAESWTPSGGFASTGAVASADEALNNFVVVPTGPWNDWFYLLTAVDTGAQAISGLSIVGYDSLGNGSWTLVDPPSAPDGGSTAMLFGMSLGVLGWIRRKLA
jgi:hypothetical protein